MIRKIVECIDKILNAGMITNNKVRSDLWWDDEVTAKIAEEDFLLTGRQQRLYGNNINDPVFILDSKGIFGIGTWRIE